MPERNLLEGTAGAVPVPEALRAPLECESGVEMRKWHLLCGKLRLKLDPLVAHVDRVVNRW